MDMISNAVPQIFNRQANRVFLWLHIIPSLKLLI